MKLLGHAWVAAKAYPEGNRKFLILGSVLPEIMYYTKKHPFKYEEIHEGGDVVYLYLKDRKSEMADLGIGMYAHSVKSGADRFNFDKKLSTLGYKGEDINTLRKRLGEVLKILPETARVRAHNILELAVEVNIIRKHPEFRDEFGRSLVDSDLRSEIVGILSRCFRKDKYETETCVSELLGKAKAEYFKDAYGLAGLWGELSRDFDPPFERKELAVLLEELAHGFNGKDEEFLRECVLWVRGNIMKLVRE